MKNFYHISKHIDDREVLAYELKRTQKERRRDDPFVFPFLLQINDHMIKAFRIDRVDYYDTQDLYKCFGLSIQSVELVLGAAKVLQFAWTTENYYYENGKKVYVKNTTNHLLVSEVNLPYLLFFADDKYTSQLIWLYFELANKASNDELIARYHFNIACQKTGLSPKKITKLTQTIQQQGDE